MHNLFHFSKALLSILAVVLPCRGASAQEEFEAWNLEPSVGQAHLVMVARVASISQVTVVEGAKTDVALREFRFQPVRRLKGIFARDELSMTASDLGIASSDASLAPPLNEGEFRLLVLVQQEGGPFPSYGCVSAAPGATTFAERVPLLTGPDDPLVSVVETLIRVADSQSRRERAKLLVDRLADADGLSAIPLLSSLRLRADWAAADERAYVPLARLAEKPLAPASGNAREVERDNVHPRALRSSAVRGAALELLRDMLASRNIPKDRRPLDNVAETLTKIIDSDEAVTRVRVAALEALGNLLPLGGSSDAARDLLIAQLKGAATYAERTAAVTALSRIGGPQAVTAVHEALAALPLDEAPARESVFALAAVRLDARGAEQVLLARPKRSIAARQSVEAEIAALGRMHSKESLPHLLTAAAQLGLSPADRYKIAWALGRLGDDRAVPVLTGWLRRSDHYLKEAALGALETLDSPAAAQEVRPLLKTEGHLTYKLRIARLLARHGLADGYSLATEHLSDASHTASAALVLAALNDPRTTSELSAVLASRPDRRWQAAALAGLAAVGDQAARKQLLEILASDRHVLAAGAAEAAGLSADGALLLPLASLVQSRNKQVAMSSLVALRRFLSGVRSSPRGLAAVDLRDADPNDPDTGDAADDDSKATAPAAGIAAETRAAIAEAVATLVGDAYVDADMRQQGLAVARLLGGDRYTELLSALADQAELEGTRLLTAVEAEMRRQRSRD